VTIKQWIGLYRRERMEGLLTRGHPRASLHAVVRKLAAKEGQA
jgi:hypothetical protein